MHKLSSRIIILIVLLSPLFIPPASMFAKSTGDCGGENPSNTNDVDHARVAVKGSDGQTTSAQMAVGDKLPLDVTPKDAGNRPTQASNISWTIGGDPGVVSLGNTDCYTPILHAVKNGTATVTAHITSLDGSPTIDAQSFSVSVGVNSNPDPTGPGVAAPLPTRLGTPIKAPETQEDRYCAYRDDNNDFACICGSQKDEVVDKEGNIDVAKSCTNTKYCVDHPGKCTRVAVSQCTSRAPLANEGPVPFQKVNDLGDLISQLFQWSLSILGLALFVMILYAGFEWLTAAGNPGQISKAKTRIQNAILGAILLLSSYIILNLINPDLVGSSLNLPIQNTPGPDRPGPVISPDICNL